jgi:maltooligosyltrehalose trehalohydrolase
MRTATRRYPIGAEPLAGRTVSFRVWAPHRARVAVVIDGTRVELQREDSGHFSGCAPGRAGSTYGFRLDDDDRLYPDPASRFQPEGPHGISQVIDPHDFTWTDAAWRGCELHGQIFYELHVGTFTPEGTWAGAARRLPYLQALGITILELMPIADFPGRFGWGYDGVNWFAPTRLYGPADDLRAFVDRAHALGLGVILDLVYNHLGPDGNYLGAFAPNYIARRYKTDWGDALDFDGPASAGLRELVVSSAACWVDEYHVDGFRFDATHAIRDNSGEHILAAVAARAREVARPRALVLVAENDDRDARAMRPRADGGYGLDASWNDDFHHAARVALTGVREAFYADYRGTAQEVLSAVKHGFLYQGQFHRRLGEARGTAALDCLPEQFVNFLENHDQVAHSTRGLRLSQHAVPAELRAMTAVLLLAPGTPLLFQGQEFGSSCAFQYFADHAEPLASAVRAGRATLIARFRRQAEADERDEPPDPCDIATFTRCAIDWSELDRHAHAYRLHQDLIRLRRTDPVFSRHSSRALDGAVFGDRAFVLRFFGGREGDRLMAVNLGSDLDLSPASEPLLAPTAAGPWTLAWSSEDPAYGGNGATGLSDDLGRLSGPGAWVYSGQWSPSTRSPRA